MRKDKHMELKKVTEVEAYTDYILQEKEGGLTAYGKQIREAEEKINALTLDMEEAIKSGNDKAYIKAKKDRDEAQTLKGLCKARLERAVAQPLIEKADYDAKVKAIYDELEAVNASTREKLADLAEEMSGLADELAQAQEKANNALHRLQHEVYRDADRTRNKDGEIIPIQAETKSVNYGGTITWGKEAIRHHQYELTTGIKVSNNNRGIL